MMTVLYCEVIPWRSLHSLWPSFFLYILVFLLFTTGVPPDCYATYAGAKGSTKRSNLQDIGITNGCSISLLLTGKGGGTGSCVAIVLK